MSSWKVNSEPSSFFAQQIDGQEKHLQIKIILLFRKILIIFIHAIDNKSKNIELSFFPVICSLPNRLRQPPLFDHQDSGDMSHVPV